jgi:hypothetical protein
VSIVRVGLKGKGMTEIGSEEPLLRLRVSSGKSELSTAFYKGGARPRQDQGDTLPDKPRHSRGQGRTIRTP